MHRASGNLQQFYRRVKKTIKGLEKKVYSYNMGRGLVILKKRTLKIGYEDFVH